MGFLTKFLNKSKIKYVTIAQEFPTLPYKLNDIRLLNNTYLLIDDDNQPVAKQSVLSLNLFLTKLIKKIIRYLHSL
jgi:hypothetical protein